MTHADKATDRLTGAKAHVAQANERLVEAGRHAGSRYLGSYEKLVGRVITAQQKLARQSRNDAVKSIVDTQVDVTRQVTSAYTSAARKLIS
jgi:hypothetical protein